MHGHTCNEIIKRKLAWAIIDERLWVISNIMLFKTVMPLKNKAILSLDNIVCIAMWSLVMYS